MAECLLRNGANVNEFNAVEGSALQNACALADYPMFKLLLKYGADMTIRDGFQKTVLHYAAQGGESENDKEKAKVK